MKKLTNYLYKIFQIKKSPTKFLLISTQRSGTTMLSDILDSHPEIYMTRELFKVNGDLLNTDSDNYRYYQDTMNIEKFLNQFFEKYKQYKAIGFTIMQDHLDLFPELQKYIKEQNLKCIYLERQNKVKVCLSRFKARNSGVYHSTKKQIVSKEYIDPVLLLTELNRLKTSLKILHTYAKQYHAKTIYYEALVKNKSVYLKDIQKYLNVNIMNNLTTSLKKTGSSSLKQSILNYDEIEKYLQNTEYESDLK